MESKPASKETMSSLIQNAGKTVQDLYIALKQDFAVRSSFDASIPHMFYVTHEIRTVNHQFNVMPCKT